MRAAATLFCSLLALDALTTTAGISLVGIRGEINPLAIALFGATGLPGLWLLKAAEGGVVVSMVARWGRPRVLWIASIPAALIVASSAVHVLSL